MLSHRPTHRHVEQQQIWYGPLQENQFVLRNQMMKECAIQPQLVTISKEVCILTDVDILAAGLLYAGFDTRHQEKSNLNRNMIRYKQFFGVDPSTAAPLFRDLRSKFPSFNYKDGLMTLNWLYLNNKQSVLSGRWKCC
jgi:hypothetical protein